VGSELKQAAGPSPATWRPWSPCSSMRCRPPDPPCSGCLTVLTGLPDWGAAAHRGAIESRVSSQAEWSQMAARVAPIHAEWSPMAASGAPALTEWSQIAVTSWPRRASVTTRWGPARAGRPTVTTRCRERPGWVIGGQL